ncbi:MAG: hypothetical protein AB7D06_17275 [Pedobacter sp.]
MIHTCVICADVDACIVDSPAGDVINSGPGDALHVAGPVDVEAVGAKNIKAANVRPACKPFDCLAL